MMSKGNPVQFPWTDIGLAGILGYFAFLSITFVFLNPPGNVPDEPAHVAYVKYWAKTGEIPVFEKSPYRPRYTAFHPPAYFAFQRVVFATVRHQSIPDQYRAMRLFSVFLHGLAVLMAFHVGLLCFAGNNPLALATAAVVGLNPMFAFMGAGVNNEALLNAAFMGVLWVGLRQMTVRNSGNALTMGLLFGLACAAKMSAVIPGLVILLALRWRGDMTARHLLLAIGAMLVVAGPVFFRNVMLYGDPLAASALYKTEPTAAGLGGLPKWFVSSFESFWGVFGWMTIRFQAVLYYFFWGAAALSVSGLALKLRRGGSVSRPELRLAGLAAVAVLAQGVWYGLTSLQAQGRYLFLGAGAFAPLLVDGWTRATRNWPRKFRAGMIAILILLGIVSGMTALHLVRAHGMVHAGVFNAVGIE